MTTYVTGDRLTDAVLPAAERLVRAAHYNDQLGVHAALADAELATGDPLTAAHALVVVLAAMCPDDTTPTDALAWRRNATEYRRLRNQGVRSREAAILAAGIQDRLWRATA